MNIMFTNLVQDCLEIFMDSFSFCSSFNLCFTNLAKDL